MAEIDRRARSYYPTYAAPTLHSGRHYLAVPLRLSSLRAKQLYNIIQLLIILCALGAEPATAYVLLNISREYEHDRHQR